MFVLAVSCVPVFCGQEMSERHPKLDRGLQVRRESAVERLGGETTKLVELLILFIAPCESVQRSSRLSHLWRLLGCLS